MLIEITHDDEILPCLIDTSPTLGRRYWRIAGWAEDPYLPTPHGGALCVILGTASINQTCWYICMLRTTRAIVLKLPHHLLPSDIPGASQFAMRAITAFKENIHASHR